MEASTFFQNAVKLINKETKKLESFCNELDKDPIAKKNNIAKYKCVPGNAFRQRYRKPKG